jgi:hypothetical protein
MKQVVEQRKIKFLFHFTRIEKLDYIFEEGLVPRSILESQGRINEFNDEYRLDGHKDANCLSISHPNYKLFYSLRQSDLDQEWVVLAINPKILWVKDCAFCYENAASNNVSTIPVGERKGLVAFKNIFSPAVGIPSREEINLSDKCPTIPQAEVLVFDTIEPKYIYGAFVKSKERERD